MNHVQTKNTSRSTNPQQNYTFLFGLFFGYTREIFVKGFKKDLNEADIYEVLPAYKSKQLGNELETNWSKQNPPKLITLLIRQFGKEYLMLLISIVVPLILTGVQPRLMKKFILCFTSDRHQFNKKEAYLYGTLIILTKFLAAIYFHNFQLRVSTFTFKMRAGLISLIYRKILKRSSCALNPVSVGNVVTLITKDVQECENAVSIITYVVTDFFKFLMVCYILYCEIGWLFISIILIVCVIILTTTVLALIVQKQKLKMLTKTDRRLQTTKEMISAIKLIKCYQWEDYYEKKIYRWRKEEVSLITKIFILLDLKLIFSDAIFDASWYILVVILISSGITSNAGTLYLIMNSLNTLNIALRANIAHAVHRLATFVAVCKRIRNFLNETDNTAPRSSSNVKSTQFTNIERTAGLIAITGPVGSGKSFLLKLIAQEHQTDKFLKTDKSFSYASQEPWLFLSTIKQNILFGSSFNHKRYMEVLRVCCLLEDLQNLKNGDCTIVADRGANLSKGQQARINLARAVYKDCDVYLLDDCLSNLDIIVSDFIFEECIKTFLKNKVVFMVTQNIKHIKRSDEAVFLKGCVTTFDTFSTPVHSTESENVDSNHLLQQNGTVESVVEDVIESTKLIKTVEAEDIYNEAKAHGKVNTDVYKEYIRNCGGFVRLSFVVILITITQFLKSYINKLESQWVNNEEIILKNSSDVNVYTLAVSNRHRMFYTLPALITTTTVLMVVSTLFHWTVAKQASLNIHDRLLSRVINASTEFFDSHFGGILLNRFSEDLLHIDEKVPTVILLLIKFFMKAVGVTILIATVDIAFLLGCLVFSIILTITRIVYLRTGRDLKRLEFSTQSPLVSHINATLDGLDTIRILKKQEILCSEFDKHLDLHTSASYMYACCEKAFYFVVDLYTVCFTTFVVIFLVSLNEAIPAGNVGLVMAQMLKFTTAQYLLYRAWTQLENYMTAMERVLQYTSQKQENKGGSVVAKWPSESTIQFESVSLFYNIDDCVLNDLSFTINSKQKIAIVGRTASGKSSLMYSLFRLYGHKGKICIDNVDISSVPLDLLRSNISIIPQEPILISGTLRENIDPKHQFSDDKIWNALELVKLSKMFQSLDVYIGSRNAHLSVGQKQLLCLCRALIRDCKILILDEVTANVDSETASLIHGLITKNFISSTVIVVTHELNYILEFDKILVLHRGEAVQFDNPLSLLECKNGLFYQMYEKNNK